MLRLSFSLHPEQGPAEPGGSARLLSPRLAGETEVLRLAVDQIEVLGGHGEERLDLLLEALLRLGETLAGGARTATALFGPEPVELAAARGEEEVHLTVLTHGMPPRLLLHRQPLPLGDLLEEIAGLARGVAGRLIGTEPETSVLRRRLLARAEHLEGPPRAPRLPPAAPPFPGPPGQHRWSVALEGAPTLTLERDPSSSSGLLPSSELGRLELGDWSYQGLLLPFLEALLEELNHALAVLDEGSFSPLALGAATLEPTDDGGGLRLAGQTLPLPVPRLLEALLGLFGDYLAACPQPAARLLEADEARRALLFRLRLDEVEGGLGVTDDARAPGQPEPRRAGPTFGPGRLRHVGLRRSWVQEHAFEGADRLQAHHRTLVISGPSGQAFADAEGGALRFQVAGARQALPLPRSRDFLLLEASTLERRRPDGRVLWERVHAPLASTEPVLAGGGLHLLEAERHLLCLETRDGAIRWRSLTATDPTGRRWLLPLGGELLLTDESGVVELFTAEGRCRVRGHLGGRPVAAPLALAGGRLLIPGRTASGELSVTLLHPDGSARPPPALAFPGLAALSGLRRQGGRLLLWGPGADRSGPEGEELLYSAGLDGGDARLLHRIPGPFNLMAWRGGYLGVDGTGRCLAPDLLPGAGARLELGTGAVSLLRFGNLVVAAAERLAVVDPGGSRVLGAIDLDPAEGPVICCRGPGRSFSLVDGHGCLQRFSVAGHLSVI